MQLFLIQKLELIAVPLKKWLKSLTMNLLVQKVAYFILHSGRPKEAQAIKEAYVDNAPNKHSFYLSTIPPILGVHVGCGLIGYGGYILDGIEEI